MSVLTDALAHPHIKRILLAEITAGEHLKFWTLNSGSTYYATANNQVADVKEDGTSLVSRASIALVDANPGSYFYDAAADRVYVKTSGSDSPYGYTLQAIVQFYFSNHPKIFNSQLYESMLSSTPGISLRVQRKFTGIPQIGGGSIGLVNSDGFFDGLTDLQWDAGSVVVKLGVDVPGRTEMAYADYETMGSWLIQSWSKTDRSFTLSVKEHKIETKKKIPYTFYDRDTYPGILSDDIGKPIQIGYGVIKDAEPVVIHIVNRQFKVAGHAIISFDGVRVKNETTGVWDTVAFATTDTTKAEFTLGSADWAEGKKVAVDFTGKAKSGVVVMDNASDVIKDVLETYLLVPSGKIDSASFTAAYDVLDRGVDDNTTKRFSRGALGVYISKTETVESIINSIDIVIGSYIFSDSAGSFFYRIFEPKPGEGKVEFDTREIHRFREVTENKELISKINVLYNKRIVNDWSESVVIEMTEKQYLHNQPSPSSRDINAVVSDTDDARRLGQALINYEGNPERVYEISVKARLAMTLLPGDIVRVVYSRHDLDATLEVLAINHNLLSDKSTLTLGDMHGLGDRSGFWVGTPAAAKLPTRFANLTGYGTGDLDWNSAWDSEIKNWARQNVGYWVDDNGFAAPTDPDSYIPSSYV